MQIQTFTRKAKKDRTNNNDKKNGLRMREKVIIKDKGFSFFADPHDRKTESRLTFVTLLFLNTQASTARKSESEI